MPRRLQLLLGLLVASAGPARADDPALAGLGTLLPERSGLPGQVLPWSVAVQTRPPLLRQAALTPAVQQAWGRQLQVLAGALKQAPVLAAPQGFHAQLQGSLDVVPEGQGGGPPARALLSGAVVVRAWALDQVERGRGGAWRPRAGATAPALELTLNEPPSAEDFQGLPWMRDEAGPFFALAPQAEVQGFPVLGGQLWLSRDGAGPFRPVSRGRLIDAFLKAHPHATGATAKLAARYGALRDAVSSEALAGPAWLSSDAAEPSLVQADTPGARPVLELAPGFLAPGPRRTAVRLVRIKGLAAVARATAPGAEPALSVYLELVQQVDWKALTARLMPAPR
jgi:hypothetical protein